LAAVITGMSDGASRKMSDGSNGSADDPDLKEVETGVLYRDLKDGTGDPCPEGAKVKINYTGWLTDGSVFDTTKEKGGRAVEFELKSLIRGWQAGIPGMKPGGIRKLVILPDKGYGTTSQRKIPPNSTLIFEVELLNVVQEQNYKTGRGQAMSDGSDGGTEDPGLKDID
jgi:peptidylprolyl isomerase